MPQQLQQHLEQRIIDRSARIAVIGLGYVGLPLLIAFFKQGFSVTGIDVDGQKIATLNQGLSHVKDVPDTDIQKLIEDKYTHLHTHFGGLAKADVIIICVPTPLRKSKEPDISYIISAAESIQQHLKSGQMIILESTTYPGTTDEILLPLFSETGLKLGQDFYLVFSPERVDPGNPLFKIENIPKVIGGTTPEGGLVAGLLYHQIIENIHQVSSARTAETVKLLENTFRSVNIALVNEFSRVCRALEINVWEVIDAAATKPFGFMRFVPGPGIGGHCIPLDPHYLIWKSRLHGYEPHFIALAEQINTGMPQDVLALVVDILNESERALKGSSILILGVSYKANIDDTRESPTLEIMRLLRTRGAKLYYHDPYVPELDIDGECYQSIDYTSQNLKQMHCAVIATAHSQVDYQQLCDCVPAIVDTRNALRDCRTDKTQISLL